MPPKRKRTTRTTLKSVEPRAPAKRTKASTSKRRTQTKAATKGFVTPRQAKYPPWSTLPLIPLSRALELASTDDKGYRDSSFLLSAATICKSFYEPAIALLYEDPPCETLKGFNKLLATIRENSQLGFRVRRLTPNQTLWFSPRFADLLKYTPNLKELTLDGEVDGFYNTASSSNSYPVNLFPIMKETGIKLKSWTWNGLFVYKLNDPPVIKERSETYVNRSPKFLQQYHAEHDSFTALRSLTLKRFITIYPDRMEGQKHEDEEFAVKAIESLRYLEELTIEQSNFCSNRFLSLLKAHKLKSLTLSRCNGIDSEGLSDYLKRQGSSLHSLSVACCPNTSLEFASTLDTCTPNLSHFEYDPRNLDNFGDEGVDSVLPLTAATPNWPASLVSLNLRHLGPWTSMECVRLLQSLLDGAETGSLSKLRELHVGCIVKDLNWRDRSEMRKKWTPAIFEAFLDHGKDEYKAFSASMKSKGGSDAIAYSGSDRNMCQRITFRIDSLRPGAMELDEDDFLDSGPVLSRKRKINSIRKAPARAKVVRRKPQVTSDGEDDEDEDFSASEPSYGSRSSSDHED